MFGKLLSTRSDPVLTIVRLVVGIIFFAHGAQKVFGWFGGGGFEATMHFFTDMMHIPPLFGFLAIIAEFCGGLGLIVGLLGRVAAFGIFVNMIVAVVMVNSHIGFFMNWTGKQKGEGFEYHLLAMALLLVLMIRGSGAYSIDQILAHSFGAGKTEAMASS
jgi:putative oxidoreductase